MEERIRKTYSLSSETVSRIEQIAAETHRADSHVIDWLVAEAWDRMKNIARATVTIEQAAKATE